MEVEAIIIDGKKYVPIKSNLCVDCALYKEKCCSVKFGGYRAMMCTLFDGHAVKRIKDEQPKDK